MIAGISDLEFGMGRELEHSIGRNICLICIFIINLSVNEVLIWIQGILWVGYAYKGCNC